MRCDTRVAPAGFERISEGSFRAGAAIAAADQKSQESNAQQRADATLCRMVEPSEIERLLRTAFPDATVLDIEDLTGTKDHYQATIVSQKFAGLSRVAQHQAVYRALGDLMKGPIHALALNTLTPDAYEKKRIG